MENLTKKDLKEILGITPKKGEDFTQETVDELSNGKGEDENE